MKVSRRGDGPFNDYMQAGWRWDCRPTRFDDGLEVQPQQTDDQSMPSLSAIEAFCAATSVTNPDGM